MANFFRLKGATIVTTAEETILTVSGSSNFIVGSLVVSNTAAATDTDVTLSVFDFSEAASFNLVTNESFLREQSKEILSRPFIMETNDELRIQCANANIIDILISYMDRDRD